jgi:glutathione S-transferase
MLAQKGLAYRYVDLLAGTHPANPGAGVQAHDRAIVKLPGGKRVRGSLAIDRALEQLRPDRRCTPLLRSARTTAEEAERWGECVLQPVPRRLIRWGLRHHLAQRRCTAGQLPALPSTAVLVAPLASVSAWQTGTSEARQTRPGLLDEVDELLERGVIGGDVLGAADFQIGDGGHENLPVGGH